MATWSLLKDAAPATNNSTIRRKAALRQLLGACASVVSSSLNKDFAAGVMSSRLNLGFPAYCRLG
jgi:hypothetical protein